MSPRHRCLVALAILGVTQDLSDSRLHAAPAALDSELAIASLRQPVEPTALPEGGYLAYQRPAQLERDACRASEPKEPLRGRVDRAVLLAANEQLNLPMGAGRRLEVRGRPYLFCLEPHYHPPGYGGTGPEGWHKGVTVYHGSQSDVRRL
jgi:hypothetical protein